MKIAVIDGDSICYLCSKDTLEESLANVDSIIASMMEETESTHYLMFLSSGKYFRHRVNPDYKAKRPPSSLKYQKTLKAYLRDQYGGVHFKEVEADDMAAYVMALKPVIDGVMPEYVCCSIDKDVIGQVPGEHLNYRTFERFTTTSEQALRFLFIQALSGDSTDNITGLPGIGPKKAEAKLPEDGNITDYSSAAMRAYAEKYSSVGEAVEEFQKNFKQVYLLRRGEDFSREVGYIPVLPAPRGFYEENED